MYFITIEHWLQHNLWATESDESCHRQGKKPKSDDFGRPVGKKKIAILSFLWNNRYTACITLWV